jgi:hypothetical protein
MKTKDIGNAILCALAVLAAILATNPFAKQGFNDDWSYAFTVQRLLLTGKLTYYGAAAPVLIQTWWAALLVRIFGFSFVVLRLSNLPWAMGCASLCFLLGRRAGLRTSRAFLAAMLLGLSPLFLPLAASFMTDVPATFFILLSVYFFIAAAESTQQRRALIALTLAFATGFAGGLDRQLVWIVPMILGPFVAWLRRKNPPILAASLAGTLIVFVAANRVSRWFYAQPMTVSEWGFSQTIEIGLHALVDCLVIWLSIWLTMLLVILPATLPAAWRSIVQTCNNIRSRRGLVAAASAIAIGLLSLHWPAIAIEPWLGDIVSRRGVLSGMELSGYRPISQPLFLREVLALFVIVIAWALLSDLLDRIFQPQFRVRFVAFIQPTGNRIATTALLLFAIVYLLLLAYRVPRALVFDRYCLPLIPCMGIPLLCQPISARRSDRIVMSLAWILTGIWSLYAIVTTQDVHALAAARRAAIDRVLASGAPDISIVAGSESDNWTQLAHDHYVNISFMAPPGKYDPAQGVCPALRPLYRVEFRSTSDTITSEFGSIDYLSWLPPFHRTIYIDRFRDPWWLSPTNTAPPPKDFEDFHMH